MWHKNCMWKILIIKEIEHLPSILNFSINPINMLKQIFCYYF